MHWKNQTMSSRWGKKVYSFIPNLASILSLLCPCETILILLAKKKKKKEKESFHFRKRFIKLQCFHIFTLKMCEMCFSLGLTEIKSGCGQDMSVSYPPVH